MNTIELKTNLKNDLHAMRTLDVEILSVKTMYTELFKIYLRVLSFLLVSVSLGVVSIVLKNIVYCDALSCFATYDFFMFLGDMFFSLLITLGISLLLLSAMNKYVLFKYTLKPSLKSGEYLGEKINQFSKVAWLIYTLPLMLVSAYNGCVFISLVIMAFASAFIVPFILQFEIQRLGLSVFFDLISEIMEKRGQAA